MDARQILRSQQPPLRRSSAAGDAGTARAAIAP